MRIIVPGNHDLASKRMANYIARKIIFTAPNTEKPFVLELATG